MRQAPSLDREQGTHVSSTFFSSSAILSAMADKPPSSGPASMASSQSTGNASSSSTAGAAEAAAKAAPKQNPAFAAMGMHIQASQVILREVMC